MAAALDPTGVLATARSSARAEQLRVVARRRECGGKAALLAWDQGALDRLLPDPAALVLRYPPDMSRDFTPAHLAHFSALWSRLGATRATRA